MNGIFVFAIRENNNKVYVGTFTDISTIEEDVIETMRQKGLSKYMRKTFMVLGTETYQLKL